MTIAMTDADGALTDADERGKPSCPPDKLQFFGPA